MSQEQEPMEAQLEEARARLLELAQLAVANAKKLQTAWLSRPHPPLPETYCDDPPTSALVQVYDDD